MTTSNKTKQLDAALIRGIEADLEAVTAQVTAVNRAKALLELGPFDKHHR